MSRDAIVPAATPWGDTSRLGRPFAKDPSVIRFGGRYLLYYSLPPFGDGRANDGWAVGIAQSRDLTSWRKVGEILPSGDYDRKGLAAPGALILDGRVHLFYQTYGNGRDDAICHATSPDGIAFTPDPTNPVFRPTGAWTAGRAIDADAFPHDGRLLLYFATRDPAMKVQMLGVAGAPLGSDFSRAAWTHLRVGASMQSFSHGSSGFRIGPPTLCRRDDTVVMFYAGAYNNEPQQVGCAASRDGVTWERLSDEPLIPNGAPGTWNASESGHPGVFVDEDGTTCLFFQGNNDNGTTWQISHVRLSWNGVRPVIPGQP